MTNLDLFESHMGDGWTLLDETPGAEWNTLPTSTKQLFHGVAQGWWEWVDVKRAMPIPFPRMFNACGAPSHWTMAHVLHELKVFDSVSTARKAGWNKPLLPGEIWLNKRTIRVLVVWVEPDS